MNSTIWVLKRILIVCLLVLTIQIAAIFHSCIYGNNFITNFMYSDKNTFLHELGYIVHAAKRPQVVVASPDKPKPKRVKQCFASNDGVKQCK